MIQEDKFIKIAKKIWKNLFTKTYVEQKINKNKKDKILKDIYRDIVSYKYTPTPPREYIVSNKHNLVSRIVPVLDPEDSIVFYTMVKVIESDLSKSRIPGTFGGFSMGGEFRKKENIEREQNEFILEMISSSPYSYNPLAWVRAWKDFQKTIAEYMGLNDTYENFIIFDIANFYDSINLNLLEKKIREQVDKVFSEEVDLLFFFLRNWNRNFEFYYPKNVGIPQDEVGDPSRILANFYLHDFDKIISDLCAKKEIKYIRYADDMILMGKNLDELKEILFFASKELAKINLNINSSKVNIFKTKSSFSKYWAFDIFNKLAEDTNMQEIEIGIELFFEYKQEDIKFKEDSVLKRLLSCNIDNIKDPLKNKIFAILLEETFISNLSEYSLKQLYDFLSENDKIFYIEKINKLVDIVLYNQFHYSVLKANLPGIDNIKLKDKIKEISFN